MSKKMYKKILIIALLSLQSAHAYQSNTIIATIPGFARPLSVAITPNGEFAYVLNLLTNSASVIATATNTIIPTAGLNNIFNVPQGQAITPNGQYNYVASAGAATIVVINTASNTVTDTISGAPLTYPESIVITPNGLYAYIANGNVINVIDLTSNTILTTPGLDTGFAVPDYVAITPDGKYVYVTNLFSPGLSVIDTASNTIIPTPGLSSGFIFPQSIAITPNGASAYVANGGGTNSLVAVNIATNTIIPAPGLTGTFKSPVYIVFTPDSRYAYAGNSTNGTVSVVEVASNTIVDTITGLSNPQVMAITPDGQYLYVPNANNNTVSVIFIGVLPPANFMGCKKTNNFFTQRDYYNYLTWSAPSGNIPASYALYRDAALTQLVATIPASSPNLCYCDHNRNPNIDYTYYIITTDEFGNTSIPVMTTVTECCC